MKRKMPNLPAGVKDFFRKTTKCCKKAVEIIIVFKNKALTEKVRRIFGRIVVALAILLLIVEAVFAVVIYGFNKDDKFTRAVASFVPYPVAMANQNIITYKDYLQERDYIHHFYQATDQQNVNLAEVDKQILDQLIENKLITNQASINGIKVSDSDIDKSLAAIVDQNGGEEKVGKVLADLYGLDLNSFRVLVKDQLIRDKINKDLMMRIKVRHILIRVDKDAAADKVEEARKKAEDLMTQARGGADFAELAKKNSEDVNSSEQGGLLEPFARGEMLQEFSDAAFKTPVGAISDPVRTDYGWHIIKVEAKTGKVDKQFSDWLTDLKQNSLIMKLK